MIRAGSSADRPARHLPAERSRVHAVRSLVVAAVGLGVTTLSAIPRSISAAEARLFRAVNGLSGAIEWPLWVVMQTGALLAIPVVALLAFLVRRRLRPALDLLVAGTTGWLLAKVMKDLLQRGRPAAFFDDVNVRGSLGGGNDQGLGFPSGHATVAFALAIVTFPYISFRSRAVAVVVAAVVGFSRMYFGAHLPLDVLGGAALGVAIAAGVHLFMDLTTHHH
ncbi:MAG: hypothetical protein AVDCRST_MAG76-3720 [uncultured Acidimicrobiales bacterium]|uniref:Phosphatidic acid phosphatase type 2/haloperoxidase domain-containing protein n=1 Tax=uncultured Acidimicrobiales bacterium TaxID=310071 RepID=A0A6J4JGL4_9ACTN|nr:MAG: hypothetical protein AVDCRST_MAG76-3720 [uncultured Acidimicrobiales bacterium]